jgi:hypothetical protein
MFVMPAGLSPATETLDDTEQCISKTNEDVWVKLKSL